MKTKGQYLRIFWVGPGHRNRTVFVSKQTAKDMMIQRGTIQKIWKMFMPIFSNYVCANP